MRELVAVGSQYPKALSQALADVGDDLASPAGQRLVRVLACFLQDRWHSVSIWYARMGIFGRRGVDHIADKLALLTCCLKGLFCVRSLISYLLRARWCCKPPFAPRLGG